MSIAREYTDARAMREAIRAVKQRLNTPPRPINRPRDVIDLEPVMRFTRSYENARIGYQFPIGPTLWGQPLGLTTSITIKQIQGEVSSEFGYTITELISFRRTARLCFVRQYAMWRCRNETTHSFPEIGRRFGDRDHSTCVHAVQKLDAMHKSGLLYLKLEALR